MRLGVPTRHRRAERADREDQPRGGGHHRLRPARRRRGRDDEPAARKLASAQLRAARDQDPAARGGDPQVARARAAGGPVDRAAYGCPCGYQFSAPVSTSVSCPHCGTDQAW